MGEASVYEYRSKLSTSEDETSITVKGETFTYVFDKKSGLIKRLEVLGDDFLSGTNSQIPEIYVSDSIDPREGSYTAKLEDEAECDIISANPYEVHVRTHGVYHSPSGEVFPVRYRITYEIQSDGTIFVIVDNKAYAPCTIRWLCISRGLLNPSFCNYFSHLADQSMIDTTDRYTFREMPPGRPEEQKLFSGRLIPWFWLGNDRTGLEICIWDVTYHRYGATQVAGKPVDPLGDVGANISCLKQSSESGGGVLWEIFSLRNLQTPVKEGWEQINYFSLSATPPKRRNPELGDLQAYWEGPRRYEGAYEYLSDDEIRDISSKGYDLIVGGVNWHSGEFIPDNESEVNRVIDTCHKHGIKIIPCVPLMDLSEGTAVFEEYGSEWQIEPVVEYEYKTHLMCPGAEGWREHWRLQIDRITQDYNFDGVYLDLWYDKLACRNSRHGCQRRYMRPSFPWVREMLGYAGAKFKAKDPDSIIAANTDILPISMICNWLDIRSVGASQDIRHVGKMAAKAFYSSYNLGCNSLIWPDHIRKIDHQLLSFSLLYMAPIYLSRERSQEEINLTMLYWNIPRFFGVNKATWYPGFLDDPESRVADTGDPDLYVNAHKSDALLLTLVNLSPEEIHSSISIKAFEKLGLHNDKNYLVYDPVSCEFPYKEKLQCDDLRNFAVTVPGYNTKFLYIREYTEKPVLLFVLGGGKALEEQWNSGTGTLHVRLASPVGAVLSVSVYSPVEKPGRIASAGEDIHFKWHENQELALFDIKTYDMTTTMELHFL